MLLICGDALIDFIPTGAANAQSTYRPVPGGSCCNGAIGLGRLGAPVGFMGALSTDFFGDILATTLAEAGVSLRDIARLVVVTQGADGVSGYTRDGWLRIPARLVAVADTVGAGDSLLAGLLWQLEQTGRLTLAGLDGLTLPELEAALRLAVGVAAITCGRTGADLPW